MRALALQREVERIAPILEENRARAEAERALTHEAYDAMVEAGLFRTMAPAAFGGMELHPVESLRVWEAVARIDSVAGWCLQISSAVGQFAAWLPQEGGEEVYAAGPDTIFAGGFFPPGPSVPVDRGWRVTARTAFASGSHRAQWFCVPIVEVAEDASRYDPRTEDPPKIVAFVPRDEVDVLDTWHTSAMRGTASSDVNVDDVFVPDHRIAFIGYGRERSAAFAGPLYGTIPWSGVNGETIVSVGIAAAAIEEFLDLALRKQPSYRRDPLHHHEMAQHHAGKASALVDASRTFLESAISEAYTDSERDGWLSDAAKLRCQQAACFGAEACAQAVDLICESAGSSAFRLQHGFERHHRDVHALTHHATKAYERYADVGKLLLGIPTNFFTLDL